MARMKKDEYRMKISDRAYWWFRNMAALPFALAWGTVVFVYECGRTVYIALFKTDGSEHISFPWE